jgi:hypothetical protein
MLLDRVRKTDLLDAARLIDAEGVPIGNQWSEYWIRIGTTEYQFKHLVRLAYKLATGEKINELSFTSSPYTRAYVKTKFGFDIRFKVPNNVGFFDQNDLDFFHITAGKPYRAKSKKDVTAGKRIKTSIFGKTNTWARSLSVDGYEVEIDERWQISGYFKQYSWARIFTPEGKKYKVYFTVGVSSERKALVYKIDCQRKAYTKEKSLTPAEVEAFDRIISGTGAEWSQVTFEEIPSYNWELLHNVTRNFIMHFEAFYLEAIYAVKNASKTKQNHLTFLEQVPPPKGLKDLPEKKYLFEGVTVDYDAQNKNASEIGANGEALVIKLEKQRLTGEGRESLAQKVRKVDDGLGYEL